MIELKNLHLKKGEKWTKLVADISSDKHRLPDNVMWFALPNEMASMFTTETYDPFLLVSYFLGMFLGENVKVNGNVSKLFYKNLVNYINQILYDFSDHTKKIELSVNGFVKLNRTDRLIGTSGSCGVDSFCSIYDHFISEEDRDYKINALFLYNCGTHGDFNQENTYNLWQERYALNSRAAKALGLPLYQMDSNLHAFTHSIYRSDRPVGYLALYSCALCLQKVMWKYYVSGDFSYRQTLQIGEERRDFDLSEFAAPMLVPLIRTELIELIPDTIQYSRSEKLSHIADWDIAHKYLNLCIRPKSDGGNCTINCPKCRSAMLVLESLGKAELFHESFDVDLFHREIRNVKINTEARYYNDPLFAREAIDYVRKHGMTIPPFLVAAFLHSPKKIKWLIKRWKEKNVDKRI